MLYLWCCLQKPTLDNAHRGKTVKCLVEIMASNPARNYAKGVVTDLDVLEIWEATRTDDGSLNMRASSPMKLNPSKVCNLYFFVCTCFAASLAAFMLALM